MPLSPKSPLAHVLTMMMNQQEEEPRSPTRTEILSPTSNYVQHRKPINLVPLKLRQRHSSIQQKYPGEAQNASLMIKSSRIPDPPVSIKVKEQTQDVFLVQ